MSNKEQATGQNRLRGKHEEECGPMPTTSDDSAWTPYIPWLEQKVEKLEAMVDAVEGHDKNLLLAHAKRLKQSDGEGWAIGEMIERTVAALDTDYTGPMETKPESRDYKEEYFDLLYCVAEKVESESRHETAKRYILEREQRGGEASAALEEQDE